MTRIRINELARELEVKPSAILEALPKVGVTEKKTHSSSVEGEQADRVRRHFGRSSDDHSAVSGVIQSTTVTTDILPTPTDAQPPVRPHSLRHPSAPGGVDLLDEEAVAGPGHAVAVEPRVESAGVVSAQGPGELTLPRLKPQPIRPPLAGQKSAAPPVLPVPAFGAPPSAAPPVAKAQPEAPVARRSAGIPVQPAPTPRPGQIISGPRQPLPAGLGEPRKPRVVQGAHAATTSPGLPSAQRPPLRRAPKPALRAEGQKPATREPIVGKPVPRPVVPPSPEILARLAQNQPPKPGQPQPRPGLPQRGRAPLPGKPLYDGPVRPGHPVVRATPGAPGPVARRRPLHPTSPRVEPPPPAPAAGRRHQTKPTSRQARERERDREGTLRAPIQRRAEVRAVNREINVSEGVTVKELSEKLGIKASLVIKKLVERKVFATINQALDAKLADELARTFGAKTNMMSFEEESVQVLDLGEETKDLSKRPPVVTVMGHVDHGKTSLLDAIRTTQVAAHEAGGITQHIGAYQVEKNGNRIAFVDTPGHEAFTRMRARGAKVTDLVVLVVAADDGVMPQTLEAIDHAKAAEAPIIVAINKCDRPDANPDRVKQQLADRNLLAEDWGGDVVMVPVSAKTQQNLDLLLEMILLVAEMQDLKANPDRPAVAAVLEARLDRGRGPVATLLVRNGTLRVGDFFICGAVFGRVRALFDDRGGPVTEAGPSMPVEVLGLESLPEVGDTFQVVTDTVKAKQIVIYRESKAREQSMAKTSRLTLDKLHEHLREGEIKELNVILKADVGGTAEVVSDALQKLSNDKVRVRVIHQGVGAVNESDVLLASASDAIIIGFNVRPERSAVALAEQEKVEVRLHTVIYELTDEVKRAMTGMLAPVYREVFRGQASVREVFRISKVGAVAGCLVQEGHIARDSQVRLLRDNVVVHTGKIASLKRFKDDASEVRNGLECGIGIENFNDIKPGDVIEAFVMERVAAEVFA